jgi:hypothetical protein
MARHLSIAPPQVSVGAGMAIAEPRIETIRMRAFILTEEENRQ